MLTVHQTSKSMVLAPRVSSPSKSQKMNPLSPSLITLEHPLKRGALAEAVAPYSGAGEEVVVTNVEDGGISRTLEWVAAAVSRHTSTTSEEEQEVDEAIADLAGRTMTSLNGIGIPL
jgi:hypothetical protein